MARYHLIRMSGATIRLSPRVRVEPRYGDTDLDCRLHFVGDRYRQLLRAYGEAVFRLSRRRPLSEIEAYVRQSAEVGQFYAVTANDGKVALRMHDAIFAEQAPLEELDLWLVADDGVRDHKVPLPLDRIQTVGALMPLLNGDHSEADVVAEMEARFSPEDREWARTLLADWSERSFLQRGPATRNAFEASNGRPRATFMGHSSIMLQSRQSAILVDPLFRVALGIPPFAFDAARLKLGAICCSHSHWDHCDVATLLRFDKRTPVVVPRVRKATIFNPPILPLLRRLGFSDIREIDVWQTLRIDDIELVAVPFHGEQDEPGAEIDHYTYVLRTEGLSVYGGVDAYRDTFGDMLPDLARVRQEWAPDVAFLPVSRMTYAWRHGGVNGFCQYVDTDLLDRWFQYTAGAEQAVEWARTLGARRVVPYAMFNFSRFDVPVQAKEFQEALHAAGMASLLLPLRPFDSVGREDLGNSFRSDLRRKYLLKALQLSSAAGRLDRGLTSNLAYRLAKRVLKRRAPVSELHHH